MRAIGICAVITMTTNAVSVCRHERNIVHARAVVSSIADKDTARGSLLLTGFSLTKEYMHERYQLRYVLISFSQIRTPMPFHSPISRKAYTDLQQIGLVPPIWDFKAAEPFNPESHRRSLFTPSTFSTHCDTVPYRFRFSNRSLHTIWQLFYALPLTL